MHLIKRIFQILAIASFTLPFSAYADSWSCSKSNDVREVHVERTTPEPVPCHVLYKKQTEGVEDQVLWNANNDAAYCEEKAQGLIAKLESVGWVCTETIRDDMMDSATDAVETSLDGAKETVTEKAASTLDATKETGTQKAKTMLDNAQEKVINETKPMLDKTTDAITR